MQVAEAVRVLSSTVNRDEAYESLRSLTVSQLREVASSFQVHVSGLNKRGVVERIINATVDAKLRSTTIRNFGK